MCKRTYIFRCSIKNYNLTFVFKNKFVKSSSWYEDVTDRRDYKLGIWLRHSEMVGKRNFHKPSEWGNNLVNHYMFGLDLIKFSMWFEFNRGGMILKMKDNE